MGLIWTDNPKGLDTNLTMIGEPNLGSDLNRAGTIYARNIVADNIAGDTTLAFNNFLSSIDALGTGLINLLKGDASDNTVLNYKAGEFLRFEQDGLLVASFNAAGHLNLDNTNGGSIFINNIGEGLFIASGPNGKAGTFVANGATPVAVPTTAFALTSNVLISLRTVGGVVGEQPRLVTATPGVGFDVVATAGDTSTYNYVIIDHAT